MKSITIPCLKMQQHIGEFYVGVIGHSELSAISFVDQRAMSSEIDDFLGIQRHLTDSRVRKIKQYVENVDATFPTSIILSMDSKHCTWNERSRTLEIFADTDEEFTQIAKILDGQHRVAGLEGLPKSTRFDLSVTIFVDVDVATQANIFATVNLAQTKVNRSLVYDLFAYEKVRSPQKSCHEITVALNDNASSPFYRRIKRLGIATPGAENETLTQAAVVESLMRYISQNPSEDRNQFMRKLKIERVEPKEQKKMPFRQLWLDGKEEAIAKIMFNYFSAVVERWPTSWHELDKRGNVLPKTNGFRALMRFLGGHAYTELGSAVPTSAEFGKFLANVDLRDEDFNIRTFPPGSSGESIFYQKLVSSNTS